jgi:hypothetical protein
MPSLGTEISPGNGMISAGIGSCNSALVNPEVHTAAAAAVVTDGHDVVHGPVSCKRLFTIYSLPIEYGKIRGKVKGWVVAAVFYAEKR